MLKATNDKEIVAVLGKCLIGLRWPSQTKWLQDAAAFHDRTTFRGSWYSKGDAVQDWGDKTPFSGVDTADQRPLAWVTYWKGTAINFCGLYTLRSFRGWGFVMWDAPRLEASGARGCIEAKHALATLPDPDPRELWAAWDSQ